MLVKRTRGNQVSLPKRVLEQAGIGDEDWYFDVEYRDGLICLRPVTVEEKIPDRAYEELLRWAKTTEPGDKTFRTGAEAVDYLKKLGKKHR
jgi:hypothetical protein